MAYRAQEDHWAAKIGGFVFVPVLSTVAGAAVSAALIDPRGDLSTSDIRKVALAQAAASGIGAYIAYRYSVREDLDNSAQAFARGGMWGQILQGAVWGAGAATIPDGTVIRRRDQIAGAPRSPRQELRSRTGADDFQIDRLRERGLLKNRRWSER